MNKEFIICSAVWFDDGLKNDNQPINIETGVVIAGRRHKNCYATAKALVGGGVELFNAVDRKNQGFLTSLNRFVDRKEAWIIALANNQIQFGLAASDNGDDSELISENLY